MNSRWPLLCAALITGIFVTGSTPSSGGAETSPGLAGRADALRDFESDALLELYAAETSLARAQAALDRLEARSAKLEQTEQAARRQAEVVQRSLAASQSRIARLLHDLYVEGESDPIAIVFGATSLEEAMAGIDGLARATALNERLVDQAVARAERLGQVRAKLASRRALVDGARAEARAGERRLAAAVSSRRATVESIRRRRSLTEARLSALQTRAQEAERKSVEIATLRSRAAQAAPRAVRGRDDDATAAILAAARPARGLSSSMPSRTTLRGSTASGLPVGVGVIAVDPAVIPLGTPCLRPGLRACRGCRRRQCCQGEHHRPLDAEHGAGARLGAAFRHDHRLRLSR